jgi:hypothetical protein
MKFNKQMKSNFNYSLTLQVGAFSFLSMVALSACDSGDSSATAAATPAPPTIALPNGTTLASMSGVNVLPFSVSYSSGNDCASATNYMNKPCVTVTVCETNGTTCHTINDILLDTGSYGLRVFKSVLTANSITLTPTSLGGSNTLSECVEYGDGSKQWGPVAQAYVGLGSEPHVLVPIQVIDSTAVGESTECSGAVESPDGNNDSIAAAGFNGILGVGLFNKDCDEGCAIHADNQMYYSCGTSTCTESTATLAQQVSNPIASLPLDNNGEIIELPNLPLGGVVSSSGYLVIGIGTRSNNVPSGVNAYTANDTYGQFSTIYNGSTYSSFLDTGSNALSFPATSSALPICSDASGWYCPSTVATVSAVNVANSGGTAGTIQFQIENFDVFLNANNPNWVLKEVGASSGSGNIANLFDWGLPFFFGRNVYVGLENTSSSALGTGPLWAY